MSGDVHFSIRPSVAAPSSGGVQLYRVFIPANTKHLYNICTTSAQRLHRWSNIVQMLFKYFVSTGMLSGYVGSRWPRAFCDQSNLST